MIRIQHGNGTETLYGHLNKLYVGQGEQVVQGQQIAEIGNNGRSTGPHLHFETRAAQNKLANYAKRSSVIAGQ